MARPKFWEFYSYINFLFILFVQFTLKKEVIFEQQVRYVQIIAVILKKVYKERLRLYFSISLNLYKLFCCINKVNLFLTKE